MQTFNPTLSDSSLENITDADGFISAFEKLTEKNKKIEFIQAFGLACMAAITTEFTTMTLFLNLLNSKQKSEYFLAIDKISDTALSSLIKDFYGLEMIHRLLKPTQIGDFFFLMGVKRIAPLIKTYDALSTFLFLAARVESDLHITFVMCRATQH